LEEYERRLANPDESDLGDAQCEQLSSETTVQHQPTSRPTAILSDDIIPSPRSSPMKTKLFDLHLKSTAA